VKDLIVVATPDGEQLLREPAPKHLRQALAVVRALQRKAARQHGPWDAQAMRKRNASAGWQRTQRQVAAAHARVANLRTDRLHKLTTALVQTHTMLGVETLAVKNMMAAGGSRKTRPEPVPRGCVPRPPAPG
jgi:putative transposase